MSSFPKRGVCPLVVVVDGPHSGAQDSGVLISFPAQYTGEIGLSFVLALAFGLDALIGDPKWLYRRIPHPVVLLGDIVRRFDDALNAPAASQVSRRISGVLTVLAAVAGTAALGWFLGWGLRALDLGWAWMAEAVLVAVLLAYRDLYDHVRRVAVGLDDGVEAGRAAVADIVGRAPETLDAPGVARAAIESAAENFSDGVVAPVFYYVLFGLPGLFAYKAVNTLDSMIGYRNERYEAFGWAAARLDDLVNLPASRLAGFIFTLAAIVVPGAGPRDAWRTMRRDAAKHRSPNAGWPEAAMAGALGLSLAGPRTYGDIHVDDSWMGDGRPDADAADIRRALRLYVVAGGMVGALGCLVLAI